MKYKKCYRCKKELSIIKFYKHTKGKYKVRCMCIKCYSKYAKEYKQKNKEKINIRNKNWRKKDKRRQRGQNAVHRKLIRPNKCQLCGKKVKLEGHYSDYDKPLEVIWACSLCHHKLHKSKPMRWTNTPVTRVSAR